MREKKGKIFLSFFLSFCGGGGVREQGKAGEPDSMF